MCNPNKCTGHTAISGSTPPGTKNAFLIMYLVDLVQPAGVSQWKVFTNDSNCQGE